MSVLPVACGIATVLACILAWELLPAMDEGAGIAASRPDPDHARTGANAGAGSDADLPANVAETLLARPLFSPDRRPAALAPPSGPAAAAAEDVPRLTGIVIGPAGALAIFDLDSGRPRIAAEGDSVGRFKVGTIASGQVALLAAEGTIVLRPRFAQSAGASRVPIARVDGHAR